MKSKHSEEKRILTKITGYSALASAALVLTPSLAKADIVHVDPADFTVGGSGPSSGETLDLDNNSSPDFFVSFSDTDYSGGKQSHIDFVGSAANNQASSYNSFLAKQESNVSLGSAWAKTLRVCYYATASGGYSIGNWTSNADEKYFGVKFMISGNLHYGWIRASVEKSSNKWLMTIHDWAYEDEAGVKIKTGVTETPTPIELAEFTLSEESGSVSLNWQTASETENSGFVIQRKAVGGDWVNIADFHSDPSLVGNGTTSETNNYSWLDENVDPGTTYQYRLGDIDHANTIVWHDIREITVSEEFANMPGEFGLESAFPNPFNPTLTIRYGLTEDAQTSVKILDLQGKTISTLSNKHQKAGSYELQWQADDNASGVYLVEVVSGDRKDLKKVLLTK